MSNTSKNEVDINEKQYSFIENIVFRFIECSSKRFMGYNIDTQDLAYILDIPEEQLEEIIDEQQDRLRNKKKEKYTSSLYKGEPIEKLWDSFPFPQDGMGNIIARHIISAYKSDFLSAMYNIYKKNSSADKFSEDFARVTYENDELYFRWIKEILNKTDLDKFSDDELKVRRDYLEHIKEYDVYIPFG